MIMRFVLQFLLVTAVAATGSHGPADIELHDTATGKLIQSVRAYAKNLPEWAKPRQVSRLPNGTFVQ
jgi:hypothetical protein